MVLFSARTGMVQALLLDNGYLTDVRTAAAGAVAARHLAREDAATACIIGAGAQARLQLKALTLVRPLSSAQIWARDPAKARLVAQDLTADLGIPVQAVTDRAAALSAADIVVTTTPASEPMIMADWLRPGQHLTAMGSDQDHKQELDPACLVRADLYIPDRQSQTALMGELRAAIDAGAVPPDTKFPELGDIVAGIAPGRTDTTDITICDLTGTGVQDTAIATLAGQRAENSGVGDSFEI